MEKATFGAGCFWCAEAAFKLLPGVVAVTPGYTGGEEQNPSYERVSSGATGHVEGVQVEYDPTRISYKDLLKIFWEIHEPTQKNQQGPDEGPQYQAVIFYHTEDQRKAAEESKQEIEQKMGPVATEIRAFINFYAAEAYHRDYYSKNLETLYSRAVIAPKIEKVRKLLSHGKL